jgi:hypothetical protein
MDVEASDLDTSTSHPMTASSSTIDSKDGSNRLPYNAYLAIIVCIVLSILQLEYFLKSRSYSLIWSQITSVFF